MKARRAQCFLDHEPLIGLASGQWKIVGNSVARSVSLALGMSLRKAWLENPEHLIRRVTIIHSGDLLEQEISTEEIDTSHRPSERPSETVQCQPVILVTAPPSLLLILRIARPTTTAKWKAKNGQVLNGRQRR